MTLCDVNIYWACIKYFQLEIKRSLTKKREMIAEIKEILLNFDEDPSLEGEVLGDDEEDLKKKKKGGNEDGLSDDDEEKLDFGTDDIEEEEES